MLREDVRGSPGFGQGPGQDPEQSGAAVLPADLARGLTFLRASNMQVMRLQLAMEREDRRGVMAAIDELVGLDRELARFIETIPDPELDDIGREIEAQKHDLMAQRVVLARGKLGPALRPVPDAAGAPAPMPVPAPAPEPELLLSAVAPAAHWVAEDSTEEARPPRRRRRRSRRWPWALAVLLLLALAVAVAAYLMFGEQWGVDARLAVLLESLT